MKTSALAVLWIIFLYLALLNPSPTGGGLLITLPLGVYLAFKTSERSKKWAK